MKKLGKTSKTPVWVSKKICGGAPVVAGTRILARSIETLIRWYPNPVELFEHYPTLRDKDIDGVLEWCRKNPTF